MTIKEIKNIKKLQSMLILSIDQERYLKGCCREAGKELGKYSYDWDGKEKNLKIQAMGLNEIFENVVKALNTIEEIAQNYSTCDDVGHYVLDTEARHALQETAEAINSILHVIKETKKQPNWINYESIGTVENK